MYLILSFLFIFSVLPLWLWRPSRKLTIPFTALFAVKIYTLLDFIDGIKSACHDTLGQQFAFAITRQWQVAQVAMDWNPFLTAGQPFAVMTNIVFWVPVIVLARLVAFLHTDLSSLQFSNAVYFYFLFQVSVGTAMLLQLLYRNRFVSLFGVASIILGGFFTESLSEPTSFLMLPFVPYLLFFLVYFLRYRSWFALAVFLLFLGDTFNHYNPVFPALFEVLFFAILATFPGSQFRVALREIFLKPLRLAICAGLFLISFAPGVYGFYQMQDYVSPTRGFTQYGKVSDSSSGLQKPIVAEPAYYTALFDRNYFNPIYPIPGHFGFYLGITPFFLLFFSLRPILTNPIVRSLALTSLFFAVFSLGKGTPVWGWLLNNVPFVNLIRHPAWFSPWVSLLTLVISMAGMRELLNRRVSWKYKVAAYFMGLTGWLVLRGSFHLVDYWFMGSLSLLALYAIQFRIARIKISPKWLFLPIFLFHASETGSYSLVKADSILCTFKSYPITTMNYPTNWSATCEPCKAFGPIDLWPAIDKEIIWSHTNPNYMYMMPKGFVEFQDRLIEKGISYGKTFYLLPENKTRTEFFVDLFRERSPLVNTDVEINRMDGSSIKVKLHDAIEPLVVESLGNLVMKDSNNPNHISLVIQSSKEAYLLRLETYHVGWHAFIDNVETKIEKIPPTFQMIRVPAGEHHIRFEFHSAYPMIMNIATLLVISGWLLTLSWFWRRQGLAGNRSCIAGTVIISCLLIGYPLPKMQNSLEPVLRELKVGNEQYASNIKDNQLSILNDFDRQYFANIQTKNISVNNLFDGDDNTAWVTPDENGISGWIVKRFKNPYQLNYFSMKIQSPESAPNSFKVSGSFDGEHWDVIGSFHDVNWDVGEKIKVFALRNNLRSYQYYKLSNFSNKTPSRHLLSKFLIAFHNPEKAPSQLRIFGGWDINGKLDLLDAFTNVKWEINSKGEKFGYFLVHAHESYPIIMVDEPDASIDMIGGAVFDTNSFSHRNSAHIIITELEFGCMTSNELGKRIDNCEEAVSQ